MPLGNVGAHYQCLNFFSTINKYQFIFDSLCASSSERVCTSILWKTFSSIADIRCDKIATDIYISLFYLCYDDCSSLFYCESLTPFIDHDTLKPIQEDMEMSRKKVHRCRVLKVLPRLWRYVCSIFKSIMDLVLSIARFIICRILHRLLIRYFIKMLVWPIILLLLKLIFLFVDYVLYPSLLILTNILIFIIELSWQIVLTIWNFVTDVIIPFFFTVFELFRDSVWNFVIVPFFFMAFEVFRDCVLNILNFITSVMILFSQPLRFFGIVYGILSLVSSFHSLQPLRFSAILYQRFYGNLFQDSV